MLHYNIFVSSAHLSASPEGLNVSILSHASCPDAPSLWLFASGSAASPEKKASQDRPFKGRFDLTL